MSKPFFSIIIPTYNRANFISRSIESVLTQSFKDFELIIIDDGSADNTEEIINHRFKDYLVYKKIINSERGAARNRGIEIAKGDYITFLDSDDYLLEHYLQNAFDEIHKNKWPPFYHQGYQIVDEKGMVLSKVDFIKNNDFNLLAEGNPLSCMGVFIRKDVLEQHRFNEDRRLAGSEDWEMWLRLSANFGLISNNEITACLVNHDYRSVKNYSEELLILSKELSIQYAFNDAGVKKIYGRYFKKMNISGDTYIALHLILSGKRKESIKFIIQLVKCPSLIFRRRTLGLIKHFFTD